MREHRWGPIRNKPHADASECALCGFRATNAEIASGSPVVGACRGFQVFAAAPHADESRHQRALREIKLGLHLWVSPKATPCPDCGEHAGMPHETTCIHTRAAKAALRASDSAT